MDNGSIPDEQAQSSTSITAYLPDDPTPWPKWKLEALRQLSEDAKAKHVFPEEDFDADGLLDLNLRLFHRLADWFKAQNKPRRFMFLCLRWRHRGKGRWEVLVEEDWLDVQRVDDTRAVARKSIKGWVIKPALVFQGLEPEPSDDDYDFCEIEDEFPEEEYVLVEDEYDIGALKAEAEECKWTQESVQPTSLPVRMLRSLRWRSKPE